MRQAPELPRGNADEALWIILLAVQGDQTLAEPAP